MDTFFDIEAQERSRVTKLGAKTQHRVVLRLVPPSASKQSEIVCARDKCVVFHNIGKAISGSTECQSHSWSQRRTKVYRSHHGDNSLLRPTGIQIATIRYVSLYKQWHRPMSNRFIKPPYSIISRETSIDSNCCRLPTASVLSNKADKSRRNVSLFATNNFFSFLIFVTTGG